MSRFAVMGWLVVLSPLGCSLLTSTDGLSGGGGSVVDPSPSDASADAAPFGTADATAQGDATSDARDGCRRVRAAVTCSNGYSPAYDPAGAGEAAAASTQAAEVIALGMYIPTSKTVTVTDRRTAPHVLFLSSYKSVGWRITTTSPGALERVVASGYELSTVAAPDGVTVENLTPGTPYADGPNERDVADLVVEKTGSPWTAFAGCYYATSYEISDDCP